MEYPTREQAQKIASENCGVKDGCENCDVVAWCGWEAEMRNCGYAMVKMHDEIDRLRGTVEVYTETILQYKEELDAKQAELDKAKDLIRRMATQLNGWEREWTNERGESFDEIDPDSAALLAEAEAMTGAR